MTPADLSTVVDTIDTLLPGWDHTRPATRLVNHRWQHPTDRETVTLTHYLTGTRWLVQLSYERGGAELSHQVLDSVPQVPMWLAVCGAATGTLTLTGAGR